MYLLTITSVKAVALLAEGVDRNQFVPAKIAGDCVALLAEGVDRNSFLSVLGYPWPVSPSSWRAWIEIHTARCEERLSVVALLAEGVDRNLNRQRRLDTWQVALLAEGVDRNFSALFKSSK